MALTDTRHAPACATTLIVSLGLLPSVADAAVIALGVVALWGRRWRRGSPPVLLWQPRPGNDSSKGPHAHHRV
ncbi:hypothetical protein ACFQFH_16900 [Halobaculum halobium]|uniref:hypothetical protein n=1 Tax=Halobaculum halobium TaxID=3032281 RepID=UPI0036115EB1